MKLKQKSYLVLGISLWLLAVAFTLTPIWPHAYYRLSPRTPEVLASTLSKSVIPAKARIHPQKVTPTSSPPYQGGDREGVKNFPPIDKSLPIENGLIIETIGVRGQLHEGSDYASILKTGLWHVPDFCTPENNHRRPSLGLPILDQFF